MSNTATETYLIESDDNYLEKSLASNLAEAFAARKPALFREGEMAIRVVCAILQDNQKVLLCQRGPKQSSPGTWEFVGGKVEAGESAHKAIVREVKEELSINVDPGLVLGSHTFWQDNIQITLVPIIVTMQSGKIKLKEHQASGWFSVRETLALPLNKGDVMVAKSLIKTKAIQ